MTHQNKYYFVSDLHLGTGDSKARELRFVRWLESIREEATAIYLLGDIFDFWFEYRRVVPKGFIRMQAKLAEMVERGIEVHWFLGNHDLWMSHYLAEELGVIIHHTPEEQMIQGRRFLIGHGDGLGPGEYSFKVKKKIFTNRCCQFLFSIIHPDIGLRLGSFFSNQNRKKHSGIPQENKRNILIQFCEKVLEKQMFDYFVFGHAHFVVDHELSNGSRYINPGEWIFNSSYAVFQNDSFTIQKFE